MIKSNIIYFFIAALLCWLFPFIYRIFFIESPIIENHQLAGHASDLQNTVGNIMQALSDNREEAFALIFANNLKGCLLNIAGGAFLGLGTVVNLMINGFYSADVFATSYNSGLTLQKILSVTLPHSFELIGFWLSGAIGFYIAWHFILFIRGKNHFNLLFLKRVIILTVIVFVIILSAAYVEAFISVS